jgi:hypothetical protein
MSVYIGGGGNNNNNNNNCCYEDVKFFVSRKVMALLAKIKPSLMRVTCVTIMRRYGWYGASVTKSNGMMYNESR